MGSFHFLPAARSSVLQACRDSDNQEGGGEDCAGLEERGQRESKEDEREDSRVEEASSVDRRENCSGNGREARTDEARVEGERDFRLQPGRPGRQLSSSTCQDPIFFPSPIITNALMIL